MNTAKKITLSEASRNFSDYINRVAYRGERFILIKGNRAVAEISPIIAGRKLSELSQIFKDVPKLDPTDDFETDAKRIRKEQNKGDIKNPWDM